MTLADLFGTNGPLTTAQECARAAVIFFYGLLLVRLAGRRAFGKWSALDIVVSIIVGSSLSRALTGGAAFGPTLAATAVMMALHWVLSHAAAWSPRLSDILEGRGVHLIEHGTTTKKKLILHAVSEADLNEALRGAGLEAAEGAKRIVLEPSGKLSVLKR